MSPIKNFSFNISELLLHIVIKYKEEINYLILERLLQIFTCNRYYLVHFKPLKIQSIVNLYI
jgi:hypothetical protein